MAARRTLAIFRSDADFELAASVRGRLEGNSNERIDQFIIKAFLAYEGKLVVIIERPMPWRRMK
jgi:hypothetical protein